MTVWMHYNCTGAQNARCSWLLQCPYREQIKAIWSAHYDEVGFPSLRRRVVDTTRPEQVKQFFRELAQHVQHPVRLAVRVPLP